MSGKLFGFEIDKQWDYENGFYLTSHLSRLPKMLAHYELYKSIVDLPGHVIECGVFKGASFIRFCTFREILESPYSRKIIGFDAFGKFPMQDDSNDQAFVERFEESAGDGISVDELKTVLSHKGFRNYELIQGDVSDTIPSYVSNHLELKIALLHIDVDVYKPTVSILNHLFDRVVTGGLVVFDDYGSVAGETKAIDEFLSGRDDIIEKLPISHMPAFIRK
ncbi:MAG: dTDP-6-deoxy-L-hexose 3-O-methyltransferase [bacterium]|nr:dTDP-6-deoxy-L-hexose 3-O-methyltransferase [bacterium]